MIVRLLGWGRSLLTAAGRHPDVVLILLMLAMILMLRSSVQEARADADRQRGLAAQWKADFLAQREEMRKFTALVRAARIQAAKDDAANVKRVEGVWSTKLEQQSNAYHSSLAAALADADRRMRGGGTTSGGESAAGGIGAPELPRLSIMPSGPLPAGGAAIISRADALNCVARGKRLEALIAAWNDAASIDVNGALKKAPEAPLQLP